MDEYPSVLAPLLGKLYIFCEHFPQPSQALSCLLKRMWGFGHTWEENRRYQEQKDSLGTENNRCKGPEAGVNVGNASCLLLAGMEGQKQQVRREGVCEVAHHWETWRILPKGC